MADSIQAIKDMEDRGRLSGLLEQYRLAKEAAKNLKGELDELALEILPLFEKHGISSLEFADKLFVKQPGCNTSISKVDLLGRGVDPDIIADCTKRTEYVTVQMRKIKV